MSSLSCAYETFRDYFTQIPVEFKIISGIISPAISITTALEVFVKMFLQNDFHFDVNAKMLINISYQRPIIGLYSVVGPHLPISFKNLSFFPKITYFQISAEQLKITTIQKHKYASYLIVYKLEFEPV